MRIKVIIDKFSSKGGLKDKVILEDNEELQKNLYEFMGGTDYDVVSKIMNEVKTVERSA